MTDRELLQQALDVMEDLGIKEAEIVSQAIRTRLEQPEPYCKTGSQCVAGQCKRCQTDNF